MNHNTQQNLAYLLVRSKTSISQPLFRFLKDFLTSFKPIKINCLLSKFGQRRWNGRESLYKPSIISSQTLETPKISWRYRPRKILYCLNFLCINTNSITGNDVAQERQRLKPNTHLKKLAYNSLSFKVWRIILRWLAWSSLFLK